MSKVSNFMVLTTSEAAPIDRTGGVIIGRLSELTDKDCEEFIESIKRKGQFIDYVYYYKDYPSNTFTHGTVWNSFISFLQSEGIDTSEEYLIIRVL